MASEWSVTLWIVVSLILDDTHTGAEGTKCFKDQTLGDAFEDNIYYCDSGDKTECCEENEEFTCCKPALSHNVEQQFVLWGTIFGIVGIIAFLWICYRKDTYMCEGMPLTARCRKQCGCSSDSDKEESENEEASNRGDYSRFDQIKATSASSSSSRPPPVRNIPLDPQENHDQDSDSGRGSAQSSGANSPPSKVPTENIEMTAMGKGSKGLKKKKKSVLEESSVVQT